MGHQAGFDMTTQEGVQAFQEQYNASLKSENADPTMTALQNMIQGMVPSSSSTSSIPSRSKPQGMEMQKKLLPGKRLPSKPGANGNEPMGTVQIYSHCQISSANPAVL